MNETNQTLKRDNPDSIQHLHLSESIKSKLIDNGYSSISELNKIIDQNQEYKIKNINGIGTYKYNKIRNAIITFNNGDETNTFDLKDTKTTISKEDLGMKLISFMVKLIEDKSIPKFPIRKPGFNYPNDNILYDDKKNVYFETESLCKEFTKYIDSKYELLLLYTNEKTDYLKIAVAQVPYENIFYYSENEDPRTGNTIKYHFQRFSNIIGNGKNYIKVYHDKLELYTNRFIDIEISDEIFENYILSGTYEEGIKNNDNQFKYGYHTKTSNYNNDILKRIRDKDKTSFKEAVLDHDLKDLSDDVKTEIKDIINSKNDNTVVILNSCKNLFQDTYLAVFSVVTRISKNKYNFDTNTIVGTYQFSSKDKYSGEILISKDFTGNINYIKELVIKYLCFLTFS